MLLSLTLMQLPDDLIINDGEKVNSLSLENFIQNFLDKVQWALQHCGKNVIWAAWFIRYKIVYSPFQPRMYNHDACTVNSLKFRVFPRYLGSTRLCYWLRSPDILAFSCNFLKFLEIPDNLYCILCLIMEFPCDSGLKSLFQDGFSLFLF